jgi:hypothetical protein
VKLVPPLSPATDPVGVDPEPTQLDEEHVLEPLSGGDPDQMQPDDPIVVDATGRLWRVRHRPAWTRMLAGAAPVLLGVLLVALLFVLRV